MAMSSAEFSINQGGLGLVISLLIEAVSIREVHTGCCVMQIGTSDIMTRGWVIWLKFPLATVCPTLF